MAPPPSGAATVVAPVPDPRPLHLTTQPDLLALLHATAEGCDGLLMAAAGHSGQTAY